MGGERDEDIPNQIENSRDSTKDLGEKIAIPIFILLVSLGFTITGLQRETKFTDMG